MKQIRYQSLIRMLCWPFPSPISASNHCSAGSQDLLVCERFKTGKGQARPARPASVVTSKSCGPLWRIPQIFRLGCDRKMTPSAGTARSSCLRTERPATSSFGFAGSRLESLLEAGRAARKQLDELISDAKPLEGDLFRFVAFRYFHPDDVISGGGTRLNGGRFAPVGVKAIYGSENEETAMREDVRRRQFGSGRPMLACGPSPQRFRCV